MRFPKITCSIVLGAVAVMGCDSKKDEPVTSPTSTAPKAPAMPSMTPATMPSTPHMPSMPTTLPSLPTTLPSLPSIPAIPTPSTDSSSPAPTAPATGPAASTDSPPATSGVSIPGLPGGLGADVQKRMDVAGMMSKAAEYMKDKKWDMADTTIKKLEDMKASLPADLQPSVDSLRKSYDAMKGK